MKYFPRFLFGLFSLLFLLFAYWQWNDPDPEVWVSIYLIAAMICFSIAIDRSYLPLLLTVAVMSFIGGVYFFPDSFFDWIRQEVEQADLSMKTIEMEKGRESLGLMIISFTMMMGVIYTRLGKVKKKSSSNKETENLTSV